MSKGRPVFRTPLQHHLFTGIGNPDSVRRKEMWETFHNLNTLHVHLPLGCLYSVLTVSPCTHCPGACGALRSSVLMSGAICLSEYLLQSGLNFALHVLPSSGSSRPMWSIYLKHTQTHTHAEKSPRVRCTWGQQGGAAGVCIGDIAQSQGSRTSGMAGKRRGRGSNVQQQNGPQRQSRGPHRVGPVPSIANVAYLHTWNYNQMRT